MNDNLPLETLKLELIQWILAEQDTRVLHQVMALKGNNGVVSAQQPIRKTKREHGFGNRNMANSAPRFDETPPGLDEYLK
jgi:hypothetical protein